MSVISLDLSQLQSVSSEIASLNSALTGNNLPALTRVLNAITSNAKGSEINGIIATIENQFSMIKTDLSAALPKLENFLEEQIKTYNVTEEQLKQDITVVLNKMANLAGITSAMINRANYNEEKSAAVEKADAKREKLANEAENKWEDAKKERNMWKDELNKANENVEKQKLDVEQAKKDLANTYVGSGVLKTGSELNQIDAAQEKLIAEQNEYENAKMEAIVMQNKYDAAVKAESEAKDAYGESLIKQEQNSGQVSGVWDTIKYGIGDAAWAVNDAASDVTKQKFDS